MQQESGKEIQTESDPWKERFERGKAVRARESVKKRIFVLLRRKRQFEAGARDSD